MGAGIGALIMGGSKILGLGADYMMNQQYISMQEEENQKNRDFNAEQAEKSRNWSTNERLAYQEYNTNERLATQEYNSPQAQKERLRAAGINPAVYFSGSGPSAVASTPQSSGLPSAATAQASGSLQTPVSSLPQLLTSFADLANSMTNEKVGSATAEKFRTQTQLLLEQIFGQKTSNEILGIQRDLEKATLPVRVKKEFEELFKLGVDIKLAQTDVEKRKIDIKIGEAQERLTKALESLNSNQAIVWGEKAKNAVQLVRSEIGLNVAKTEESIASAEKSRSEVSINKQEERIRRAVADLKDSTWSVELETSLKDLVSKGAMSDANKQEALNKIEAISHIHDSDDLHREIDDFIIWAKERINILK